MTRFGLAAAVTGAALTALGWVASWGPVLALGVGLLLAVTGALVQVSRRPRLVLDRSIEPARVEKGSAAVAVIRAANRSRRVLLPVPIEQRLGQTTVRAELPRLRRGERVMRAYRLPTAERGVLEVGPVELPRADPFGLCRTVQRLGAAETIAVHPRLLALRPLATGTSRNLEGPSSDTSPQGTVTFHRLREYVVGDDLRHVHWPSTARLGQLVVRHHVDTAQPYSVILLDVTAGAYGGDDFEEAVDVAASVAVALGQAKAPVQLRTSAGELLGGPGLRDTRPIVDHLTTVKSAPDASLAAEVLRLSRDRGGTALVAVTGSVDPSALPPLAALHRRFDRILVLSITAPGGNELAHPGLTVISATGADDLARKWNQRVVR
jgi:uncharacterized protein (DUF58 family)